MGMYDLNGRDSVFMLLNVLQLLAMRSRRRRCPSADLAYDDALSQSWRFSHRVRLTGVGFADGESYFVGPTYDARMTLRKTCRQHG